MQNSDKSRINSFIAFGFGSSDTEINLYWSDDALKTIKKLVHKQLQEDDNNKKV